MIFRLANREAEYAFPLIEKVLPLYKQFYKETGETDYAVSVSSMEDLMALDALARTTDRDYKGMFIAGTTISLIRKGDTVYDYI